MFRFNQEVLYLDTEQRKSAKTGKYYTLVHLLVGNETVSLMYEGEDTQTLKRFDKVLVDFVLTVGRYTSLSIEGIKKVG